MPNKTVNYSKDYVTGWRLAAQQISESAGSVALAAWKQLYSADESALVDIFSASCHRPEAGLLYARQRAMLLDRWIKLLAGRLALPNLAIYAVAGYGRGLLAPKSDIDLLLIGDDEAQASVEPLLRDLWDMGFGISLQRRSWTGLDADIAKDMVLASALLRVRHLAGHVLPMPQLIPKDAAWRQGFIAAKHAETIQRSQQEEARFLFLQPDLKQAAGGWRDLQIIEWADQLGMMAKPGWHGAALARLWRLRVALHLCSHDRGDRLLFGYQAQIAELLAPQQNSTQAMGDLLAAYFEQQRQSRLALEAIFTPAPIALPTRFKRACLLPPLPIGAAPALAALAAKSRHDWSSAGARRWFGRHLADQPRPGRWLQDLARMGVLRRILPDFAKIEFLPQFDLYHVWPVGAHILRVLDNLDSQQESDPAIAALPTLRRPQRQALRLAALMHDMAKGRSGNHEQKGARLAERWARYFGYAPAVGKLAGWLVEHHQLLSAVAQKEDIDDPELLAQLQAQLLPPSRLLLLLRLTAADIAAVAPRRWEGWTRQLVLKLVAALQQKVGDAAPSPVARPAGWAAHEWSRYRSLWPDFARARLGLAQFLPLGELWRQHQQGSQGASQAPGQDMLHQLDSSGTMLCVRVVTLDRPGLFACLSAAFSLVNLDIRQADIFTLADGVALDQFLLGCSQGHDGLADRGRRALALLPRLLAGDTGLLAEIKRQESRAAHYSGLGQVRVEIAWRAAQPQRQILECYGLDRPGLLYRLTQALTDLGGNLLAARVATYGQQVVDQFVLDDSPPYQLGKQGRRRLEKIWYHLLSP